MYYIKHKNSLLIFIHIILLFLFIFIISKQYKHIKIEHDAVQNVANSYYLVTKGIYSNNGDKPVYRREPFPNLINALNIRFFTSIDKSVTVAKILEDPLYVRQLTRVNILYLALIYLSIWWIIFLLLRSHWPAFIGVLFLCFFFDNNYLYYVQSLFTDILAAGILSVTTGVLIYWYQKTNVSRSITLGILLGILTLTKAAFYYISLGLITLFLFTHLLKYKKFTWHHFKYIATVLIAYCTVIFPWMLRNYMNFNDFAITQRGGDVLLIRAVKNQMTDEEYKGAYYAYSPSFVQDLLLGPLLGFKYADLNSGGVLQRLNRDLPEDLKALEEKKYDNLISYYHIAKSKIINEYKNKFPGRTSTEYESFLKKRAIQLIKENPWGHLRCTFVFAWRGIWPFVYAQGRIGILSSLWSGIAFLSFFTLFFLSLIKKRTNLLLLTTPSILYFLFYALFTHYISRYSIILLPILSVSTAVLFHMIFAKLVERFFRSFSIMLRH